MGPVEHPAATGDSHTPPCAGEPGMPPYMGEIPNTCFGDIPIGPAKVVSTRDMRPVSGGIHQPG